MPIRENKIHVKISEFTVIPFGINAGWGGGVLVGGVLVGGGGVGGWGHTIA